MISVDTYLLLNEWIRGVKLLMSNRGLNTDILPLFGRENYTRHGMLLLLRHRLGYWQDAVFDH